MNIVRAPEKLELWVNCQRDTLDYLTPKARKWRRQTLKAYRDILSRYSLALQHSALYPDDQFGQGRLNALHDVIELLAQNHEAIVKVGQP